MNENENKVPSECDRNTNKEEGKMKGIIVTGIKWVLIGAVAAAAVQTAIYFYGRSKAAVADAGHKEPTVATPAPDLTEGVEGMDTKEGIAESTDNTQGPEKPDEDAVYKRLGSLADGKDDESYSVAKAPTSKERAQLREERKKRSDKIMDQNLSVFSELAKGL